MRLEIARKDPRWWLYIVFIVTGFGFYWALRYPKEAFQKGLKRNYIVGVTLGYVVLSLAGFFFANSTLTPWMFVYLPLLWSVVFREQLRVVLGKVKQSIIFRSIFCAMLLMIPETSLSLDTKYDIRTHLLTFLGFYLGLLCVFLLFNRQYKSLSFVQLYTVGGILGVIFEQNFQGLVLLFSGKFIEFLLFAIIIFQVYGFYLASPKLLFYEELQEKETESVAISQNIFLLFSIVLIVGSVWFVTLILLAFMGLIVT